MQCSNVLVVAVQTIIRTIMYGFCDAIMNVEIQARRKKNHSMTDKIDELNMK